MLKLYKFLQKYSQFFLFLFLEVLALVFYFTSNSYQASWYFNTSNAVVGDVLSTSAQIQDYFQLKRVNEELAQENALLRKELIAQQFKNDPTYMPPLDSLFASRYSFADAKVINNSSAYYNNYLTINKGSEDSIKSGMGVISPSGVVGKVKSVSRHYSNIVSVLHHDLMISSKIKHLDAFGSLRWEGPDPSEAILLYIPRHLKVKQGDTILTSGYNSVFPENVMVGRVKQIKIKGDESFFRILVQLSTDFSRLSYVYVVKNNLQIEQDSLETVIDIHP